MRRITKHNEVLVYLGADNRMKAYCDDWPQPEQDITLLAQFAKTADQLAGLVYADWRNAQSVRVLDKYGRTIAWRN